eukprot:scaffold134523_cov71-Attheya_sp.AAC.1
MFDATSSGTHPLHSWSFKGFTISKGISVSAQSPFEIRGNIETEVGMTVCQKVTIAAGSCFNLIDHVKEADPFQIGWPGSRLAGQSGRSH